MKLAMLAVLIYPVTVLGFSRVGHGESALDSLGNADAWPHRDSLCLRVDQREQRLAFAGLSGNTLWFNTTLGLAMFLGRFAYVIPVAGAGGFFRQEEEGARLGRHIPDGCPLFVGLLLGVVVILYRSNTSGSRAGSCCRALPDASGQTF